jgi:hypothetical protein
VDNAEQGLEDSTELFQHHMWTAKCQTKTLIELEIIEIKG